jgi:hypothetical protein
MSTKYYTIKMTGGTSQGPYTIYTNQVDVESNIPTIYPSGGYAKNISKPNLQAGVIIKCTGTTESIIVKNNAVDCDNKITLIPPISDGIPMSFMMSTFQEMTELPLSSISVNQPSCTCDGSVLFNVNLDNPPFTYSINNGVTYSSFPIFTNLCSGIYSLSVMDSLGSVYSNSVTLNQLEQSTTYNISLYTTSTTPVNSNDSLVNSYETEVVITPPLPDGATITFDIIHSNSFYSSPNSGTSILTTSTILYKNNSQISANNTLDGVDYFVNTVAGCQKEYVYQSNINDIWNSLTISNGDLITISTSSQVDRTTSGECVVGYSTDSYSISNPIISGCNCCSIKTN